LNRRARKILSATWRGGQEKLREIESERLGRWAYQLGHFYGKHKGGRIPPGLRFTIEGVQPRNPLKQSSNLPGIDLVIPCASKDANLLPLAVHAAVQASANRIEEIRIFAPMNDVETLGRLLPEASVLADETLIPAEINDVLIERVPEHRRGWVIQQLVKIMACMTSTRPGCLVVDADTVILRNTSWLSRQGIQALMLAHEYHEPYADHAASMWGLEATLGPMSFVTHFQLMQRDIWEQMLSLGLSDLIRWLELADFHNGSPVSEYHSYGAWIVKNQPQRVRLAQWANQAVAGHPRTLEEGVSTEHVLRDLRRRYPRLGSVSFHSYMR
jgi:hypothetical protein